jgi:hypothetical protein
MDRTSGAVTITLNRCKVLYLHRPSSRSTVVQRTTAHKGIPTIHTEPHTHPNLIHKLTNLQQPRIPLPLRLHNRLPPLIPHLLAIRQLDQLLHLLQREHLLRQALQPETPSMFLRARHDRLRPRCKQIQEQLDIGQRRAGLYILQILLQDEDVELHQRGAMRVHGFQFARAEGEEVHVHERREARGNQRVAGGGDVRADFGVEGDELRVEDKDGGVGVAEERVDGYVGPHAGVEREEDCGADGEVEGAEDAGAEGLVGGDYAVEFAGGRVSGCGCGWRGETYVAVAWSRGRYTGVPSVRGSDEERSVQRLLWRWLPGSIRVESVARSLMCRSRAIFVDSHFMLV